MFGNTLLVEGVCIKLTWRLHNHDVYYEYEIYEVKFFIKCHSLSYAIFNANMTLFEMSLSWHLDNTTCHKHDIAD